MQAMTEKAIRSIADSLKKIEKNTRKTNRDISRRKIKLISVFDYKTGKHVDINDVTAFFLKDGKVIALKYTTTNDVGEKMESYTDKCDVEVDFE